MGLEQFGFFEQMPVEEARRLVKSLASEVPRKHEADVVQYLRGGAHLMVSMGVVFDVLDEKTLIGHGDVFTDGAWLWPWELVHYVENYHIALPPHFVRHMENNGWKCPTVSDPGSLDLGGVFEQ